MDAELVKKLIVPAAFVAVVGLCVLDAHLTRRTQLKAMKIVAATETAPVETATTDSTES